MTEENKEAPAEDTSSLLEEAAPTLSEGEFFLSEGIKGAGDIPEWYNKDKYQSISEQAKGYSELHKQFGSFTGAPKDGYLLPEGVTNEDALVAEVIKFGEETNLHQAGMEKLLDLAMSQAGVTEEVSVKAELAKLGDDASNRIKTVENFLRNKLGAEYEAVMPLVSNADSVMLVETLIKATQPAKLPIDGNVEPGGLEWKDIESEMFKKDDNGNLLRSVDSSHEAKIQRMMKEFGGDRMHSVTVG